MADKKLNEVTKVTDMAYVPVIMADGSIGQIAKSDLASVVAGILNPGYVNKFNVKPSENGYVKLYTTKSNGNSCALITLHRYNNRPMAVICVYLHPERTVDTLVCKYIIGEKNSTSYDLKLYYTANSDGSYSIYSTHTYLYPSSVSFLLNHNTIVNNETISSLPSGATEANIVHNVFGYNSLAELAGGVAENIGLSSTLKVVTAKSTASVLSEIPGVIVLKRVINDTAWIVMASFNKTSVSLVYASNPTLFKFGEDSDNTFNLYAENGIAYIKYNSTYTATFNVYTL